MAEKYFPYKFTEISPEEKEQLKRICGGTPPDYVRLGPKGYTVPRRYEIDAANIYNMPLRLSDIFVATYQRSGTTWTQELVWLINNNLDYETAAKEDILKRYYFLDQFLFFSDEYAAIADQQTNKEVQAIMKEIMTPLSAAIEVAPSPRYVKTHLPMSLLPPKILDTVKVVYVARDPRDVAVSSFHHTKLFKLLNFNGDFKDFWNIFHKDLFTLTPFFEHIKEAWNLRHHPNMLFLFYEELSKELPATLDRVAKFLGKELTTEQRDRLCEHLKFDNFKNNKTVNFEPLRELGLLDKNEKFVRKGKAGGWRDYFDEELSQQADQWIADNLRDTDLRFPDIN